MEELTDDSEEFDSPSIGVDEISSAELVKFSNLSQQQTEIKNDEKEKAVSVEVIESVVCTKETRQTADVTLIQFQLCVLLTLVMMIWVSWKKYRKIINAMYETPQEKSVANGKG
mmetsp:Transcript_9435/g.14237  ORF Transcript_9435/g.14237 Transcript_9435/m.14237 type:complete len:114 (+) Transcript_9435:91-432(+)|eukprot:CAMPEP_0171459056 /NCGR_PEP_ID=MMETSP0945-20130129/4488_1 /TAXON_ID=109269 /ORGANISM="Vaucheria litorea, Strain CCMP2940" /LENGTH=113 /DNA_ID=CAMNT_0011984989 /DNA_START=91 /DNA_END=432 /DNA_ORIENTATION=-